jgi:hypothetical protein
MPGKQVSWANERGGTLVQQRGIPAVGSSRRVSSRRKPSKPIRLGNMNRVIRERQVAALQKLELSCKRCQEDITKLQKKHDELIKQESVIASQFNRYKNKNIINISPSLRSKMKQINKDIKLIENTIKDKRMILRQMQNKKKALNYSIKSSRK